MKKFLFNENVISQIYKQAITEYPEECCGWIIQQGNGNQSYTASKNLQNKYHKIDPVAYPRTGKNAFIPELMKLNNEINAISDGGKLFSIVHSHIEVGAYFSDEDVKQMSDPISGLPTYNADNYLVVSVSKDQIDEEAVFYFDDTSFKFEKGQIIKNKN